MNLYIINESNHAAIYGIGTYINELTVALRHTQININVVNIMSDKPQIQTEKIKDICFWHFPKPASEQRKIGHKKQGILYYKNIVYLFHLYIENKKELIFHLNYNHSSKLAIELKKAFDCRIVTTIHYLSWSSNLMRNITYQDDELKKRIYESYLKEKEFFENVDHIICLSKHTRHILQNDYQIKIDRTTVISNGLTDMVKTESDPELLRIKWKIPMRENIIHFVGRIDEAKGLSYLIKAFRKVLEVAPDCRLIISGNGRYDACFQEARGICTKVTFTGLMAREDLYELYSIADIGILPSLTEQCSYVVMEMMMHGLPIITISASGLSEMTEDGVSSLQVPVMEQPNRITIDTDLLAAKIIYLLEHRDMAKQLGWNARKRYEEKYSMEVFRRNMLDFYRSLQGRSK